MDEQEYPELPVRGVSVQVVGAGVGIELSVGTGDGTLPLKYPAPLPHEQHMSEDVKSSSSE